jgi:hypothetical protein
MPDLKRLSRGWSDDLSPAAIEARLAKVAQLYRAWKILSRVTKPDQQC